MASSQRRCNGGFQLIPFNGSGGTRRKTESIKGDRREEQRMIWLGKAIGPTQYNPHFNLVLMLQRLSVSLHTKGAANLAPLCTLRWDVESERWKAGALQTVVRYGLSHVQAILINRLLMVSCHGAGIKHACI